MSNTAQWELAVYWFATVAAFISLDRRLADSISQSNVHSWFRRPSFDPPSDVFGVMWPILYSGMTVAAVQMHNQLGDSGIRLGWLALVLALGRFAEEIVIAADRAEHHRRKLHRIRNVMLRHLAATGTPNSSTFETDARGELEEYEDGHI